MRYHLLIPADIAARGSRCDKTAHRDITVPNRGAAYKTVIRTFASSAPFTDRDVSEITMQTLLFSAQTQCRNILNF